MPPSGQFWSSSFHPGLKWNTPGQALNQARERAPQHLSLPGKKSLFEDRRWQPQELNKKGITLRAPEWMGPGQRDTGSSPAGDRLG